MKKKTAPRPAPCPRRSLPILVWFDLEFSSLDFDRAHLMQAAMTLTDFELRRLGPETEDVFAPIRLPPRARISPWVRENLASLVRACKSPAAISVKELDRRLAAQLDRYAKPSDSSMDQRPVLAGNSVHADWAIARRLLPEFSKRLHYRHLDVTAFKLHGNWTSKMPDFQKKNPAEIRRWFPEAALPDGAAEHDASFDVQASIAELAFYRKHLFR